MSKLDILAFNALDAEKYLLRVRNRSLLDLVHDKLATKIRTDQVDLYNRVLARERSRYVACNTADEYLGTSYAQRYERYRERTADLARRCVSDLFERSAVDPRAIRALVTNTTVGGTIPCLSSVIGNHLDLPHDFRPLDLGYMGCATALLALEVVETQLRPGEVGLVLSSELTSIMSNLTASSNESLIANTVFGDGVGAFLVAKRPHSERSLLRIRGHSGSIQVDKRALAAISYEPSAVYHEIRLADSIAEVAARGVRLALEPLIRRHFTSVSDKLRHALLHRFPNWQRHVDYAVLHTAGNKILNGLVKSLDLKEIQVQHNFTAFQKYSNTSSASLYYAFDELTRQRTLVSGERLLFLAYGSGFMVRAAAMEVM